MGAYVPTGGGSSSGPTTTPADNLANPAAIPESASFGLVWDFTNNQWVRARAIVPADGIANPAVAVPQTLALSMLWDNNAVAWQRIQSYADATGVGGSKDKLMPAGLVAIDPNSGTQLRALQVYCPSSTDSPGTLAAAQPSSNATEATAAANTSVVTTYGAAASQRHRLTLLGVSWSGAAATTGLLTVADGGTTIVSVDVPITLNAPFFVPLPPGGIQGSVNTAMTITLAAGGAGAIGKLNTAKLTG